MPVANGGTGATSAATARTALGVDGVAMPIGTVFYFPSTSPPANALKANGAAVSRTTYAALFAVIGTTFGAGDGSTTFNVPEARGEFIRSLDDGRGVDSGRALGTAQAGTAVYNNGGLTGGSIPQDPASVLNTDGTLTQSTVWNGFTRSGVNTQDRNYAYVRPRNVAFLACIRF